MYEQFKHLDNELLEELIVTVKNQESEDGAEEVLKEFCEHHKFDYGDFQEYLAVECNCSMCARCGRYFGEDEFSDNDEDCIYCCEEEEEE